MSTVKCQKTHCVGKRRRCCAPSQRSQTIGPHGPAHVVGPPEASHRLTKTIMFLFLILFLFFSYGSGKGKKKQLNDKFRDISDQMKAAYDNGDLDRVLDLYHTICCEDGDEETAGKRRKEKKDFKKVKKEIRADIYRYIILSYFALDMPELGDTFLKKFLVLRRDEGTGEYWLSIREAAESKYYVAPRLLLGGIMGLVYSDARPFKRFSVLDGATSPSGKEYDFDLVHSRGGLGGFIVEFVLTKNLSLKTMFTYGSPSFQYKNKLSWGNNSLAIEFTHRHKLYCFEIPFLLKYRFGKPRLKPFIQIGGFLRILEVARKSIDIDVDGDDPRLQDDVIKDIDISDLFNTFDGGLWVGAGIGRSIGKVHLEIDINYLHGFKNIVNKNNRYDNEKILFGYYDVFDDMKLSSLNLTFKVLLPISFKAFKKGSR